MFFQQKSPKPSKSKEDAIVTTPTTAEKKSLVLDESSLTATPGVNDSAPCFNVDSDVLARSPSGSVADLTQIQSDTELDKSTDAIQESNSVIQESNVESKQESTETKKHESVENGMNEESEASKLTVTVTSPQGTE